MALLGLEVGLCLGLLVSVAVSVYAAENARRQVLASGGTVEGQSATHRVSATLGQWAAGRAVSPQAGVHGGFWQTLRVCACPHVGDLDTNYALDIIDVTLLINIAFRGAADNPGDPFCPVYSRADVDCTGAIDVLDVSVLVNTTFRDSDIRCDPCAP